MTALTRHSAFETSAPFRFNAATRYRRAAKQAAIVAGVVLASPVMLPWLCYGAWITAREINRSML